MDENKFESAGFSGEASLALIESMINRARNQFSENGHLYLLWGWVVFACSIIHYLLYQVWQINNAHYIWMATWLAVIYMIIYLTRQKRHERVRTYTHDILGYLWIVFGITMLLLGFILGMQYGSGYYKFMNPVFLAIYGTPTFLSGVVLRFTPLKIGGICCWILSVTAALVNHQHHLLFIALAMVLAWIIPGYLLRIRFKNQTNA